jgi:hypothetical protein
VSSLSPAVCGSKLTVAASVGQVHLGTVDAVDTRQRLLDVPHAGGAGHAADVEVQMELELMAVVIVVP